LPSPQGRRPELMRDGSNFSALIFNAW